MTMAPPLFLALALAYAGLTSLSLAMKRHHDQVMGRKLQPERVRYYRWPGWLLLALSLWVTLTVWPLGLALFMAVGLGNSRLATGVFAAVSRTVGRTTGCRLARVGHADLVDGGTGLAGC